MYSEEIRVASYRFASSQRVIRIHRSRTGYVQSRKMMISLLQQAIKEDIFILLQHDKTANSIWDALKVKFEGSENMIKSKKALLKKEFDMFSSLPGEDTKKLIERYCHLVRSMSMLSITKDREEWVDKLADALPQKEWGTYLMILKIPEFMMG
ncbi:hypothetical protein HanIR_Chr07g0313751 [Helianthus annuus]|nr:hypothetical protein HanIR_Chr07g0313751 [Helianthus annuus]